MVVSQSPSDCTSPSSIQEKSVGRYPGKQVAAYGCHEEGIFMHARPLRDCALKRHGNLYYINKYAVIKKSNKIVKETHVPFMRYPRLALKNARSGKSVDVQVDKLMANAFMRYEFTDTQNIIIGYINSDKNNDRLAISSTIPRAR
ncbi:hypothetical protein MUCCIDRAFT_112810 [Mucor lusitanicus CBS 277.49]|uniref:Uncharacterized protein n=1 Tax=Mucor lusitanicus CBS 277.49 TaxID=747725 RepID=A0A162YY79_MUCCL|nr:hypothetical protein MUCCIDRAFT_112810 [Mucor lusitanicus CBS 277.49]